MHQIHTGLPEDDSNTPEGVQGCLLLLPKEEEEEECKIS